jgi:hypothetical protein
MIIIIIIIPARQSQEKRHRVYDVAADTVTSKNLVPLATLKMKVVFL